MNRRIPARRQTVEVGLQPVSTRSTHANRNRQESSTMRTKEELEKAIQLLKDHDRDVEATEISIEDGTVIPVDGIPRTPKEILEMADRLKMNN